MVQIKFFDVNPFVLRALSTVFADVESVEVLEPCWFDHCHKNCDAIVSPANSYGLMDGSLDKSITDIYNTVEERVQDKIVNVYRGVQPVGTCLTVPLGDGDRKLLHAPTMVTPMSIKGTNNVYFAFRAILIAAEDNNIDSILCSGLGTAVGQLDPEYAAKQMKAAYDSVELSLRPSWDVTYIDRLRLN